ncbi:hypothetical protein LINPERHAP2_LOCUS23702, partial [Linum perenne]
LENAGFWFLIAENLRRKAMSTMTISLSTSTLKPSPFTRLPLQRRSNSISFLRFPAKPQPSAARITLGLFGFRKLEFSSVKAQKGDEEVNDEDDSPPAGGGSSLPDRFRFITKEAPDPPLKWPWFVALGVILYTWRSVLYEVVRWTKFPVWAVSSILSGILSVIRSVILSVILAPLASVLKIVKFTISPFLLFILHPLALLLRFLDAGFYTIQSLYFSILHYTSVSEFTLMIILSSTVLSIGEAAVPNSVNSQRYLLTLAGLIGFSAVANYISEPLFWTLLFGMYSFSRWVMKRDHVTSALPAAAVFAAIGEPWVRVLVMGSYSGLAVYHHSKNQSRDGEEEEEDGQVGMVGNQVPVPLLCAALAIGIKVAAKWAGYRHLRWMLA